MVPGRHLTFSLAGKADGWFEREGGYLMLGSERLIARRELLLLGDHNVANALAAALMAIGTTLFVYFAPVRAERLLQAIESFARRARGAPALDGAAS